MWASAVRAPVGEGRICDHAAVSSQVGWVVWPASASVMGFPEVSQVRRPLLAGLSS